MLIEEPYAKTGARHLNDGLLRILAVLAEAHAEHPCVLLEELENGINPELVGALIDYLRSAPHQVFFTTHSPLLLNYLTDDEARASVFLIYKTPRGVTRSVSFFRLPEIEEKITVMGPGEAFVDTDLNALVDQLNAEGAS